jgi:hypothetical protein
MRLSNFRQLWLYDRAKTMSGHLTHLGETNRQHAAVVLGRNPGSDSQSAQSLVSLLQPPGLDSS